MVKVTDSTYRLPTIEALSSFGVFESGATLPMRVWGVDRETGERGQYVVKYKNQSRMIGSASSFEFLGAWMAQEIGLNAAEPVAINISENFVSTLSGRDGFKAASQSIGLNFGSKYVAGVTQIPPTGFTLTNEQIEQAKQLFVLDLFMQNTDRGHVKPNVGLHQDDLFVYDHELAFSFLRLLSFARSKTPWILDPADSELYKKHFFYRYLKGQEEDFSEQVNELTKLNDDFWRCVNQHMPVDFKVDELTKIKDYLLPFLNHLSEFAASIHKTMTS
ncbi:MAG: hypothetical protein HC819_22800 [Cyclobacteriaceae bacterium]|nr:hypothetical protein [Cyclobacteriaceae bacterium]